MLGDGGGGVGSTPILLIKTFWEAVNVHIKEQGRSSSIGAKILSIVLRQLTEDFKEKTLKMNLPNIEYQFHILLNNNLNLGRVGEGCEHGVVVACTWRHYSIFRDGEGCSYLDLAALFNIQGRRGL